MRCVLTRLPCLRSERAGASFAVRPLQVLLAGGEEAYNLRQRVTAAVSSDPAYSKRAKYNWERSQLYENTLCVPLYLRVLTSGACA